MLLSVKRIVRVLFVPLLRIDGYSISDKFEGRLSQYERGKPSDTIDNTAPFLRYDFPVIVASKQLGPRLLADITLFSRVYE